MSLHMPYTRVDADAGRISFTDNNLTATDETEIAAGAAGTKRIIYYMQVSLNYLVTATTPKNVRVYAGTTILANVQSGQAQGSATWTLPYPIVIDADVDLKWVGSYNVAEYQRWLSIVYADVAAF